jgi:hypothetical protein
MSRGGEGGLLPCSDPQLHDMCYEAVVSPSRNPKAVDTCHEGVVSPFLDVDLHSMCNGVVGHFLHFLPGDHTFLPRAEMFKSIAFYAFEYFLCLGRVLPPGETLSQCVFIFHVYSEAPTMLATTLCSDGAECLGGAVCVV